MKFITIILSIFILISCAGNNSTDDKPNNNVINANENKPDVTDNKEAQDEKNNKEASLPDPKFNFKTEIKYKILNTKFSRTFCFQTENVLIFINLQDKKSILDLLGETRTNEGLAQFFKLVIESSEAGFINATSWLAQIPSVKFNNKILLHFAEDLNINLKTPEEIKQFTELPVEFTNAAIINLNLPEISETRIITEIWKNLIPFENGDIKIGLALLQPLAKINDASFYYKFINSTRILVNNSVKLQFPSPYFTELYNEVRADWTAFILENSKDLTSFCEVGKNIAELEKYQKNWIENREAIAGSDSTSAKYLTAVVSAQQEQELEALNILQTLHPKELKVADGGLYNLATLAFFAGKYEYVRKYLEEKFLPVEFYIKKENVQKLSRIHNHTEMPLAILLTPLIQGDYAFNKKLAVFFDNLGFKLTADFLILSENIFNLDEQIQKIADEDFQLFSEKCPENYSSEFTFWFGYLKMFSALKSNKINSAKAELDKLAQLPVSKLQIDAANFLFESHQK